jgi:hypothetical protein
MGGVSRRTEKATIRLMRFRPRRFFPRNKREPANSFFSSSFEPTALISNRGSKDQCPKA